VRPLAQSKGHDAPGLVDELVPKPTYGSIIKDAVVALWEASDRVCGKRLKVMIPTLLPALEQHGRLKLGKGDRDLVLAVSAAIIDRVLYYST
jgi:hypothetical protein